MLNWLKFTFGSFTSNALAKEGAKRSFWNVIFALFMLLMLLTAFFSTGVNYSFSTHYSKADKFHEFSYSLFANDNESLRVNLEVKDPKEGSNYNLLNAYYGLNRDDVAVINTYENEQDKAKYSKNGYEVIIDTRDTSKIWIDFDVNFYNKKDSSDKVSYDEYLKLDNKSDYSGKVEFKYDDGKIKLFDANSLTDEEISSQVKYVEDEYLKSASDTSKKEWEEIKGKAETDSYKDLVYEFYTKAYYNVSLCPNLSYYYQTTYSSYDNNGNYIYTNFILLTDTWAIISFTNEKNITVMYYGYYTNFATNFVLFDAHTLNNDVVKGNIDALYKTIYTSSAGDRGLNLAINIFRYYPMIIIAMAVLALFIYCFAKIKRGIIQASFFGNFKIVSSFIIGASTISGILAMTLSFFINTAVALSIGIWSLLGALSIRSFVFAIVEAIKNKNVTEDVTEKPSTLKDVIDVYEEEGTRIDLSKVDTGTKIINNDDVDEDDEEKMELM